MSYSNHITLVLGHRGSGKTTWLFRNIDNFQPFVLIDPLFDPKFQSLHLYTPENMTEAYEIFRNRNPQRIYISPNLDAFDFFCALCLAKGGLTLVIDEVDNYATNHYISPRFKQALKYGRHRKVNLVMVARRPKEVHPLLRSQATRFIIFPLGIEDTKELQSHLTPDAAIRIKNLQSQKDHWTQYMDYDFHTNEWEIKTLHYVLDTLTEA